ncbi:hypothetical protein O181_124989 [Austropuccinia psidii MF-1]|uniref:Uncharacterized protein n=1 Tax=Austropuccinia psidii MF-1 TaxID=1389203 RepID=A0A9Q3Q4S5_9BASI|nr:hypothetical protein [Austropuccinia psidii MF-1]
MEFVNLDSTNSRFVPWSCFFKTNENQKEDFLQIKDLSFETIERRYKALMAIYKTIRDACNATEGGGIYMQLQRHHMTMEVYELLKERNINNCGTFEVGMESGDFPQTVDEYGSIPQDDMVVPMEGLCEQGGRSGSEILESLPREVMSDWPEDQPNMPSQPERSQETHHGATPLCIGC